MRLYLVFGIVVVVQEHLFPVLELILELSYQTQTVAILQLGPESLHLRCQPLDLAYVELCFPQVVLVVFAAQSLCLDSLSTSLLHFLQLLLHRPNQNNELTFQFCIYLVHSLDTVWTLVKPHSIINCVQRSRYNHTWLVGCSCIPVWGP